MNKNLLKKIIIEQKKIFEKELKIVDRDIPKNIISTQKIVVITGVRRCGKSTLLRQISKLHKIYYYINFEDERLIDFTYKDFDRLLEVFFELYPHSNIYFFDEIQNIFGWEKFIRRLYNNGNKIFITGSNAKLLSSEIATSLTGRNLLLKLYPFNFKEILRYYNFPIKEIYTTKELSLISKYLNRYIKYGGFPEIVKSRDVEELIQIYQDIIIKDLLIRYKIRDINEFRELSQYLLTNISKKYSYNNLKLLLEFSNTSKVKNYIEFLKEGYLFYSLSRFDYSIKKQIKNQRKIYSIDPGLVKNFSSEFSKNLGRIIENIVFLELIRNNKEIFYFEENTECDFIIKKKTKIIEAIQVSTTIKDLKTKARELKGLLDVKRRFNLKRGTIITLYDEDTLHKNVRTIPLWKFLLFGF